MSLEKCEKPIPSVIQGEDKNLDFRISNELTGDPVDLTAASEVQAIFLNKDNSYLIKKLSDGGIVLISGPGGHFQVQITAAESALLAASQPGCLSDIESNFTISGKKTIVIFSKAVQILTRRYPNA